jgi:hypothetical protein
MMVQGPKRCGICSGVKSSRGLFLHLDLDAPVLCAAFGTIAASQDMSATAIRQWVRETAQRLEDELAEEQDIFILAASGTGISFRIRPPMRRVMCRGIHLRGEQETQVSARVSKLVFPPTIAGTTWSMWEAAS